MSRSRRPTPGEYLELGLAGIMRWMPASWASAIGAYLGARRGRRGIAAKRLWVDRLGRNLERLQPEPDPRKRAQRIVSYTSRIGRQLAEYMVLHKIVREGRLEVVGSEHLQGLSRPVIVASCHLANWELVGHLGTLLDTPAVAVYDPPENPIWHRLANSARLRWRPDYQVVPASPHAMRQICKALASGCGLLMYVDEVKDGYLWAPSLGRRIPYTGNRWLTARLAVRYRADILPVHVERVGAARFRLVIAPKLVALGSDEDERARSLADQMDGLLNSWIGSQPDHWYGLWEFDLDQPLPERSERAA
jgi:KDO2-lipid IV(A) lauroyltransferase